MDAGRIVEGTLRTAQEDMRHIVAHYSTNPEFTRISNLLIKPSTDADLVSSHNSLMKAMIKPGPPMRGFSP